MKSKTILVKIILPSQTIFKANANLVNIPGSAGVFGVLPGHAKLISTMKAGIVGIFTENTEQKFFVYGGMVQVNPMEVNLVTEFATSLANQNKTDIQNQITELKSELEKSITSSLETSILENQIKRYIALLGFL